MTPFLSRYMGEIEYNPQKRLIMFGFVLYKSAKLFTTAKITNSTKKAKFTTESWTISNNRTNN